jgi:hypothetical protein
MYECIFSMFRFVLILLEVYSLFLFLCSCICRFFSVFIFSYIVRRFSLFVFYVLILLDLLGLYVLLSSIVRCL